MSTSNAIRRELAALLGLFFVLCFGALMVLPTLMAQGEESVEFPTVDLSPHRDVTIRAEVPDFNDGSNRVLRVGSNADGFPRRALLGLELEGEIPAGSQILSASLSFFVDNVGSVDSCIVSLHRVRSEWGEGESGAGQGGATWSHAFYATVPWGRPGGDAKPFPSGGILVLGVGNYRIQSGNLVADLQDMLDHPESNHGWILSGSEGDPGNWKQFGSGDNSVPSSRPRFVIEYSPLVKTPPISSGRLKSRYRGR